MWLYEHGIPFEGGAWHSSAIAAPAYAGIPARQARGFCREYYHRPRVGSPTRGRTIGRHTRKSGATLVFVMGTSNLANICRNLIDGGLAERYAGGRGLQGLHAGSENRGGHPWELAAKKFWMPAWQIRP